MAIISTHHARVIYTSEPAVWAQTVETAPAERVFLVEEKLTIDAIRRFSTLAYQRPRAAAEQVLVIASKQITYEAQQALLKLLEEPPVTTRLILILPPTVSLLPTVRSRVSEETIAEPATPSEEWEEWQNMSVPARLAIIESSHKAKNISYQEKIGRGLIATPLPPEATTARAAQSFVTTWLGQRGAANKMLLEYAALYWPVR